MSRVTVDLDGFGRASCTLQAFEAALKISKRRMANAMAEVFDGRDHTRNATVARWMRLSKPVLAVVWCDAYHGHNAQDDSCSVCGHVSTAPRRNASAAAEGTMVRCAACDKLLPLSQAWSKRGNDYHQHCQPLSAPAATRVQA